VDDAKSGLSLQAAAEAGQLSRVVELLNAGADLQQQDHNGLTALMAVLYVIPTAPEERAAYADHLAVAELLIERGSDLTLRDSGGRNALEWARGLPDIQQMIVARGGVRSRNESIEFPYDRADFPAYVKAFFSVMRRGEFLVEPRAGILAYLRPDMPADLKALLHTWAHKPSGWLNFGYWELDTRLLFDPASSPDQFGELQLDFTPAGALAIGQSYYQVMLLATWQAGDERMRLWAYDDEYQRAEPLNSFDEFLQDLEYALSDLPEDDEDDDEDDEDDEDSDDGGGGRPLPELLEALQEEARKEHARQADAAASD